jgi:hypothetical protein
VGAYIDFVAFREAPSEASLMSVRGLKAFRLFKHNVRPEWYLKDADEQTEFSFFGPLRFDPTGDTLRRAKSGAKSFYDALHRARLESWGLDNKRIVQGLAIGCEIGLPTLLVYGNSRAGVDAGFIFEAGQVKYARLNGLPNGVLVFDDDGGRIERPQAEEFDDDGVPLLDEFQFGTEVANRFFEDDKRWRVTPHVDDARDYSLLLERRR